MFNQLMLIELQRFSIKRHLILKIRSGEIATSGRRTVFTSTHGTKYHVWLSVKEKWMRIQGSMCYFFDKVATVSVIRKVEHHTILCFENRGL